MDHGGEAARPTTVVESTEIIMAGAVSGDEAHIHTGTFDGQLLHRRDIFNGQFCVAAARRGSFDNSAVYHNSAEFARHVRTAAGPGELFVALFHGEPGPDVLYANVGDFWRQLGPGDEVPVAVLELPDPEGVVPVHDNYGYYQLQPCHGVVRGEVLVNLLPDGVGVAYDNHAWQFRPGAGRRGIANLLTDAAGGAVYGPGNFAQGNDGMVTEHLRRLLALVGICACSVAINGLAAGPGSPAVAFRLFVLLLGSLLLVILHVLCV